MADLASSGLTAEQMALMMELSAALAVEARPCGDETAERRRARDREYQAAKREQEKNRRQMSADSAEESNSPSPVFPPNPLSTPTRNNNPARVKGTRLDEHWKPEKLTGEAGKLVERYGQQWAKTQFEAFQNFWIAKSGKDACKTDWQRTWANWIINANPPKTPPGQPPPAAYDEQRLAEMQRRYSTQ
jgi:hypothetical protein